MSAEIDSAPTEATTMEQAPAEAAAAVEPAAEAAEEERVSAKLLARIRATEQRTRSQAKAAEAKAREAEETLRSVAADRELQARAKAGDWKAREALLEAHGISYDDLTRWKLTGGRTDPAEEVKRELSELKTQLSEREKQAQEAALKSAWEERLSTFASVAQDPSSAAPLVAGELQDDPAFVHETVKAMVEQNAQMTYLQAVQAFEAYLRQQTERRYGRIKPAIDSAPAEANTTAADKTTSGKRPRDSAGQRSTGDGPRRLTNASSSERSKLSTPSNPRNAVEREQQEKERIRRAIDAMSR
jgi:hypothetical protein